MGRKRNKFLPIRLCDEEYEKIMEKLQKGKEKGLYKTYAEYIIDVIDKSNIEIVQYDLRTWDKELKKNRTKY